MTVISLNNQSFEQQRHWTQVDVYEDIQEVPKPYTEIAVLEISSAVTKERMVVDSQQRAAELGGSGILLEHAGTHTEMNMIFFGNGFVPVVDERWEGRVLVIRVI